MKQLKANYEQAGANVEGLAAQLAYNTKRLADVQKLTAEGANTEFKEQDNQVQYETVNYQLQAAKAAQINAKLAMDSEIGGVNTTVAQIQAQLEEAKWQLDQATIHAPGNGYVTSMALAAGDRATQARAVMSFIVTDEIALVGMFSPNGFQTIKPGAPVKLVFDNDPGRIHHGTILDIPLGVGQGQIAVSGTLARVGSIGGANAFPAQISLPEDINLEQLRLGMPGTATVFADNAGVIGLIMSILCGSVPTRPTCEASFGPMNILPQAVRLLMAQSGGSLRCKSGAAFRGAADAAAGRRVTDRPMVLSAVFNARNYRQCVPPVPPAARATHWFC